jgi:hypothetical protein
LLVLRAAFTTICMTHTEWNAGVLVAFVLPALFTSLPPLAYPHLFSFVLAFGCFLLVCFLSLYTRSCFTPRTDTDKPEPTLMLEATSPAASSSSTSIKSLHLVRVSRLVEALESHPAEKVLASLYEQDDAFVAAERVLIAAADFAIISYRQQRDDRDSFTMDAAAFRSAVREAQKAGIAAVWLDAWCYRQSGPYDHSSFCEELGAVMNRVSAVVWLPRSRTNAPASYQFRLWCSFEATVVAERNLPVFVAGQGLSRSQRALRHLGSLLPALPGLPPPKEVRSLAYINSAIGLACAFCPLLVPVAVVFIKSGACGSTLPIYALEAAYAQNGSHVLSAMRAGMQRGCLKQQSMRVGGADTHTDASDGRSFLTRSRTASHYKWSSRQVAKLREMLPWLPAYDRRDALVILRLLDAIGVPDNSSQRHSGRHGGASEQAVGSHRDEAICALAVSCYAAARVAPSPGDAVGSLSLSEWLKQKELDLPIERPISLAALGCYGWKVYRGAPDVVSTPTGKFSVSPTVSTSWDASDMQPMEKGHGDWQVASFFCFLVFMGVVPISFAIGIAIDYSTAPSGASGPPSMLWTMWLTTVTGVFYLASGYAAIVTNFLMPWIYNRPQCMHAPSYGGVLGVVGYNAWADLGVVLCIGYVYILFNVFLLLLVDTFLFSHGSAMWTDAYSNGLALAAHPGVSVAPAFYIVRLASVHLAGLYFGIVAAHVLWHMWQSGRHDPSFALRSPDTKAGSVVSFVQRFFDNPASSRV